MLEYGTVWLPIVDQYFVIPNWLTLLFLLHQPLQPLQVYPSSVPDPILDISIHHGIESIRKIHNVLHHHLIIHTNTEKQYNIFRNVSNPSLSSTATIILYITIFSSACPKLGNNIYLDYLPSILITVNPTLSGYVRQYNPMIHYWEGTGIGVPPFETPSRYVGKLKLFLTSVVKAY